MSASRPAAGEWTPLPGAAGRVTARRRRQRHSKSQKCLHSLRVGVSAVAPSQRLDVGGGTGGFDRPRRARRPLEGLVLQGRPTTRPSRRHRAVAPAYSPCRLTFGPGIELFGIGGASQSPARRPGGPAARAHLPLNPPVTSHNGIAKNRNLDGLLLYVRKVLHINAGASPAAPCGSCALWQLVEGLGSCDPPE